MKRLVWFGCLLIAGSFAQLAWADDPQLIIETGGHKSLIRKVLFTSDGRYLVSAGDDKAIRVWDVQTGEMARTIRGQIGEGNEGKIFAVALSPDDQYLAVGGFFEPCCGDIRLYSFSSGQMIDLLKGHTGVVQDLKFSPDGRYLASGGSDQTVRVWDITHRRVLHVLKGHTDSIYTVDFAPDGKRMASGSVDSTLRLWDVRKGDLINELKGHEGRVFAAVFSPDGNYLASASFDKTVRLWDANTGEFVKILGRQETAIGSLSFDPKNRWVLAGSGVGGQSICTVFAMPSGHILTKFTLNDNIVIATAVSPDGKVVATGGGNSFPIYMWDPGNGQVINKLVGHGQRVWSVGFSKDGNSISYGNELMPVSDNDLGPLQHVITLNPDGQYRIALGDEVAKTSDYLRAIDRSGLYRLQTKTGISFGYQAILQILNGETVMYEIERDAASGYGHKSYTFTHDGRYVISGGMGGALAIFEAATGKQVHDLIGHTGDVYAVAVSPDNKTLVSGSNDQTVRLWDIGSGKNLLTVFVGAEREWVAWTPEGYYTSSLNGDKYIGWHVNQGDDKAAKFYPAAQFKKQFYRPDVVAEYLKSRDITVALQRANERRGMGSQESPVATPDIGGLPDVFVYSPDDDETLWHQDTITVKARVKSEFPITGVNVFVNGIQIAGQDEGRVKGNPRERRVELQVSLKDQTNVIKVIASNDKGDSTPQVRTVVYPEAKAMTQVKPDLILLAVGISEYKDGDLMLEYADDDAEAVAKAFERQQGAVFKNVKVRLLNKKEDISRVKILSALDWFSQEGTKDDIRVLFLSGHGGLDRRKNYYFYSYDHDATASPEIYDIKWSTLLENLTDKEAPAILLVDTCHGSGIIGGGKRRNTVDFTEILKEMKIKSGGLVTFAASTGTQTSVEHKAWAHGAFTQALLEGLEGKADSNNDKKIDTDELGFWVKRRVRELAKDIGGQQEAVYFPLPPELKSFPIFELKP